MDDSKFLIIGANGQLGKALKSRYPRAQAVDITELDITNAKSVAAYDWSNVSTIFNAAAYTNVDGAETPEGRVAAWKVNAVAVSNLVKAAIKHNLAFVHISTDYVFDGTKTPHTEDEPFSPLSSYAATKVAGDIIAGLADKLYILRTTMLIGEGNNFVRTMLSLGERGINPSVVNDQFGRLTFTTELVRAIDHLLTKKAPFGTYNLSNGGDVTHWADVTRFIFKEGGYNNTVTEVSTAEYFKDKPEAAKRPLNETFDLSKIQATGFVSRDWREDLHEYIAKEMAAKE